MVFAWFFSGFPLKQWNNAMKLASKVREVLLRVGNQLGQKSKFLSGAWERIILLSLGLRSLEPWFLSVSTSPSGNLLPLTHIFIK